MVFQEGIGRGLGEGIKQEYSHERGEDGRAGPEGDMRGAHGVPGGVERGLEGIRQVWSTYRGEVKMAELGLRGNVRGAHGVPGRDWKGVRRRD